jgi:hypothetical protein
LRTVTSETHGSCDSRSGTGVQFELFQNRKLRRFAIAGDGHGLNAQSDRRQRPVGKTRHMAAGDEAIDDRRAEKAGSGEMARAAAAREFDLFGKAPDAARDQGPRHGGKTRHSSAKATWPCPGHPPHCA